MRRVDQPPYRTSWMFRLLRATLKVVQEALIHVGHSLWVVPPYHIAVRGTPDRDTAGGRGVPAPDAAVRVRQPGPRRRPVDQPAVKE